MPPILLRCVGVRLLKLLSMAALLAGVLMWADHRVSAQDGKTRQPTRTIRRVAATTSRRRLPETISQATSQGPTPIKRRSRPRRRAGPGGNRGHGHLFEADGRPEPEEQGVDDRADSDEREPSKGTSRPTFDEFFQTYFFPSWADPSFIAKVQDQRTTLRTFFHQSRSGPVHDHLLALSMQFLKILAEKNFHPAARYNAMLAIGELNDSEPSPPNPAVPYAGRPSGAGGVAQEGAVGRLAGGGASRPAAALHVGNRRAPRPATPK